VLEGDFFGNANDARAAIPHLRARGVGAIVNVGSVSSRIRAP